MDKHLDMNMNYRYPNAMYEIIYVCISGRKIYTIFAEKVMVGYFTTIETKQIWILISFSYIVQSDN